MGWFVSMACRKVSVELTIAEVKGVDFCLKDIGERMGRFGM
jgi:hypothetical protein